MTQLATLFTLAGLIFYVSAREHAFGSKSFLIYQLLAWLVFFPLAVLSKETAFLFPLFVLLLELFVLQKDRIDNRTLLFISVGLTTASLAAFWWKSDYFLGGYEFREFEPAERLLTQARVVVTYLGMLLIPAQQRMGFLHDDVELSTGLLEPWTTAPAIVLLALLLVSAFYFRKKQPLYSFGILFFFAGHLLESTIFPLELMYEHRNYLPSIGFFLALSITAKSLISERKILILITACYLALLSFTTWLRADIWSSDLRILYFLETNKPSSQRASSILSELATKIQDYDSARNKIAHFDTLGAKLKLLHIDCLQYKKLNDEKFKINISQFKVTDSFAMAGLIDIAQLGMNDECHFSKTAYLNLLNDVLTYMKQMRSNRQMLYMYKAHYQWRLEQKERAISTLEEGFTVDRNNPTPLFLACEWALDEHLNETADVLCPKALQIAETIPYRLDDLIRQVRTRLNR